MSNCSGELKRSTTFALTFALGNDKRTVLSTKIFLQRSGTYSHFDFGTGSQLPFVGRPWGMNNWAVQSNNRAGAWVSTRNTAPPVALLLRHITGLHLLVTCLAQMDSESHWWFHPEDREFYGFRCTHQASPVRSSVTPCGESLNSHLALLVLVSVDI